MLPRGILANIFLVSHILVLFYSPNSSWNKVLTSSMNQLTFYIAFKIPVGHFCKKLPGWSEKVKSSLIRKNIFPWLLSVHDLISLSCHE